MLGSIALKTIHDRTTAQLTRNAQVAPAVVDDPFPSFVGEKIKVMRSIRDDPLAGMRARDQIEDYHLAAGRLWQKWHELSEVGCVRAIDPLKEAVDGGKIPEPITDVQIKAIRELTLADRQLGLEGCALIRHILGERLSLAEAARRRGMSSDREINYIGRRLKECLDTLARIWGLRT